MIHATLFFTVSSFSFTIVMHTTPSMFQFVFNEVNENLIAYVPSNSIYQYKTNINNWAGVQWDRDAHMGT